MWIWFLTNDYDFKELFAVVRIFIVCPSLPKRNLKDQRKLKKSTAPKILSYDMVRYLFNDYSHQLRRVFFLEAIQWYFSLGKLGDNQFLTSGLDLSVGLVGPERWLFKCA